jgi:hypothetical protein
MVVGWSVGGQAHGLEWTEWVGLWGGCSVAVLLNDAPLIAAPLTRFAETDACSLLTEPAAAQSGQDPRGAEPSEGAAVLECRVSLTDALQMDPGVHCITAAVHCLVPAGGEGRLGGVERAGGDVVERRVAAARTVKFVLPAA